jgi:hypothetical protein
MAFRCDLHVHSIHSDGSLGPEELVAEAARQRLDAFALTDHDTTAGLARTIEAGRLAGIEVIAGIEVSVSDDDGKRQLHLLGLGVDPEHALLRERVERFRQERGERGRTIVRRLREQGVAIEYEQVSALAHDGAVGRPHVAQALVELGVCRDQEDAFRRFLGRGRPANVARVGPCARDAIELIHRAGGVASLAHPDLSIGANGAGGLEAFIARLVPLGLDALEVDHPSHKPGLRKRLRRYAQQHGLIQTGGSDFHGASRPDVVLGRGRGGNVNVGARVYEALHARISHIRAMA